MWPIAASLGHWEGDHLEGARGQSVIGTLVERTSRLVKLVKLDDGSAPSTLAGFTQALRGVPPQLRNSLTYDRGTEMALHQQLAQALGMQISTSAMPTAPGSECQWHSNNPHPW